MTKQIITIVSPLPDDLWRTVFYDDDTVDIVNIYSESIGWTGSWKLENNQVMINVGVDWIPADEKIQMAEYSSQSTRNMKCRYAYEIRSAIAERILLDQPYPDSLKESQTESK